MDFECEPVKGLFATLLGALCGAASTAIIVWCVRNNAFFPQCSIIVNIAAAAVGALGIWLTSLWLIYNLSLAFYNVLERFLLVFGTLVVLVCTVGVEFGVFGIIEAYAEELFRSEAPRYIFGILSVCVLLVILYLFFTGPIFSVLYGGRTVDKLPVPKNVRMAVYVWDCIGSPIGEKSEKYVLELVTLIADKKKKGSDKFFACCEAARILWHGTAGKCDPKEALRYAEQAVGCMPDVEQELLSLEEKRYINKSIECLEILTDAYLSGVGVEANPKKARLYYPKLLVMMDMRQKLAARDGIEETETYADYDDVAELREESSAAPKTFDFPILIMDDLGREWKLDYSNGDEARYVVNSRVYVKQLDDKDSLIDGTAYLKRSDMETGTASYMGRTFIW